MKKHWYMIYVQSCPVCGHETVYKERRYGRKPKAWDSRHRYSWNDYDYCLDYGWM